MNLKRVFGPLRGGTSQPTNRGGPRSGSCVCIGFAVLVLLALGSCAESSGEPTRAVTTRPTPENLITNPGFPFNPDPADDDGLIDGWRFYAGERGLLTRPHPDGWRGGTLIRLDSEDQLRALYQDVTLTDAEGQPANTDAHGFVFTCRLRGEPGSEAFLSTHDTQAGGTRRSANLVADGQWHTLRVSGTAPATGRIRVHVWVRTGAAFIESPCVTVVPAEELLDGPRSAHDATGRGVELVRWDDWDGRLGIESKAADIALTFSREDLREGGFLMNIMGADHQNLADYMCLPDDLIVAADADNQTVFVARSHALQWEPSYAPSDARGVHETGFLEFARSADDGWNTAPPLDPQPWTHYTAPPLDIRIRHEMGDDERWVPMTVTATNRYHAPLRVTYLIQDGAWMTDFEEGHQHNVHQYWPDGEYADNRAVRFDAGSIASKDAWGTIYNDAGGGMSATLYVPPGAPGGVLWMATWDQEPGRKYIDAQPWFPEGWHTPVGMLRLVDLPVAQGEPGDPYDAPKGRFRGALLDLGFIEPGETASAVIVKIFDTGYADRADMVRRIESIIDGIPPYTEHWLHRPD
jgi:hypothetical protein